MAVLEKARTFAYRIDHVLPAKQCRHRLIASGETLGEHDHIRNDALLLTGQEGARSAGAAHDFVKDEMHTVLVTDLADTLKVAGYRGNRSRGRADDRLGDETRNTFGTQFQDLCLELVCNTQAILLRGFVCLPIPVFETRRDVMPLFEQRREHPAAPLVAADTERAKRVAVVALLARDKAPALGFAALDEVLTRQFEGSLGGFGPARQQQDFAHAGTIADQSLRQFFEDIRRKKGRMCVRQRCYLLLNRGDHPPVAMAETGHGSATASVEKTPAIPIEDIDAVTAYCGRRVL